MRLNERHDEMLAALGGFYRTWIAYLGIELEFFHALRAAGTSGMTIAELAARTETHPKAVATWAWAAGAHDLISVSDVLRVDDEIVAVLLEEDRTAYLGGQVIQSVVSTLDWDRMLDFFRTGIPSPHRPDRYRMAIERVTRQDIAVFFSEGLAAIPNLVAKLSGGGRVLDVHCGGGRWLVAMAQRFPKLTLVGIEAEEDSRTRAERLIEDTDLADRIRIEAVARHEVTRPGRFDLAYYQYALHALPDPAASIRASWESLEPDGWLLVLDWLLPTDDEELHSIQGELIAGVHLDEVFMGAGLHDADAFLGWFTAAGTPSPEVIELPSGATLFVLHRPPTT
ncbi:MAG: class I SAM-dependent methyltransferase [Chloroflexota bacterium]